MSINFAFQLLYNNEPAEVSQEYIDLLIKKFEQKQITLFNEEIKGEMIKVVALVIHKDFLFHIDGYEEDSRKAYKGLEGGVALVILANDKPLPMVIFWPRSALRKIEGHCGIFFTEPVMDLPIMMAKMMYIYTLQWTPKLQALFDPDYDFFKSPEFCMFAYKVDSELEKYFNF